MHILKIEAVIKKVEWSGLWMKEKLLERFINYVKIDTQADWNSKGCPSTAGQLILAQFLKEELIEIGMSDVTMDELGYIMATLPKNTEKDVPTIGFLAHLDTAAEFSGKNVNPQVHENYNGEDITLNEDLSIILSPEMFPNLPAYRGHTLITTDGTTLLGCDDKSGIAEIMTAMDYLIQHPEIKHGEIRVAFTPDEEIGRGPHNFDVKKFNAKYAYTLDGGPLGELQYENFNAANAKLTVTGHNIHSGRAKDKMLNASKIAMEFHCALPSNEAPEFTENYEGFYHLLDFVGDVENAKLNYFIRDFDKNHFEKRKKYMLELVTRLKEKYGEDKIFLDIYDQYYNMLEKVEPISELITIPKVAMKNIGVNVKVSPIRGGTDGAQLSYMGLPTPNLFIGGENFHGKFEFASLEDMEKAMELIVEIARIFEEES